LQERVWSNSIDSLGPWILWTLGYKYFDKVSKTYDFPLKAMLPGEKSVFPRDRERERGVDFIV